MKALVYSDWGIVEIKDVPPPELLPGETIIRVEACGICGSELEAFKFRKLRRTPPLILGHEFCGLIDSIGEGNNNLQVGQRVVGNSVLSCGSCFPCLRGDRHLCSNRQVPGMDRPGAMAEFVSMPLDHIYPCPDTLDPTLAALTEPLVNGIHIMNMAPPSIKPSVAIIGAGPIGLMVLQAAVILKEARILVADVNEARLVIAKELGAEGVVNPTNCDLIKECTEFSGADGVDICIDAVGTGQTKGQSIEVLRPGGTVFWIGLYDNDISISSYKVTVPEKRISGTYAGKKDEFELAIKLLAEKKVVGGRWVKVYPIDEGVLAFKRALKAEGNDIKTILIPKRDE